MLECDKPVIARVNGHAVGLGATVALMCDIIIAADTARIGDPHVNAGLVAGDGALIWPQLIGFARAKEYLFTGDLMTAAEAHRIGLINHVVPADALDEKVYGLARRLATGATESIRWTKQVINIPLRQIAHSTMDPSLSLETQSNQSKEHQEAVSAFARNGDRTSPAVSRATAAEGGVSRSAATPTVPPGGSGSARMRQAEQANPRGMVIGTRYPRTSPLRYGSVGSVPVASEPPLIPIRDGASGWLRSMFLVLTVADAQGPRSSMRKSGVSLFPPITHGLATPSWAFSPRRRDVPPVPPAGVRDGGTTSPSTPRRS